MASLLPKVINFMDSAQPTLTNPADREKLPVDPTSTASGKKVVNKFQDSYFVTVPQVSYQVVYHENTKQLLKNWAPGYQLKAPQLEYTGGSKEEVESIHRSFQENMSKISSKINKQARSEEGLSEIFTEWKSYCDELVKAYKAVGFRNRDQNYALLHLTVNLLQQKFPEKFKKLQENQTQVTQVFHTFFVEEPWKTNIVSLKTARIDVVNGMSAAQLGTKLVSAQNGDTDTPSISLDLEALSKPAMAGVVDRLRKWFSGGPCDIYEFRIEVKGKAFSEAELLKEKTEIQKRLAAGQPTFENHLNVLVDSLFENMKEVEIELFSLVGTDNVAQDCMAGHQKLATRILQKFSESKRLKNLQRLNVDKCWVDFETLATIKDVLSKSGVTSLRLANLKMGLEPVDIPAQMQLAMRSANCTDVMNRLLQCHCSIFPCCFCCKKLPDYEATRGNVEERMNTFHTQYKKVIALKERAYEDCAHSGFEDLRQALQDMSSKGCVDVIDFEGTNLPDLCGTTEKVNTLLRDIANQKPTALNLKDSGLCDVHVPGLCQAFFMNHHLAHFEVSLCSSSTDGLENLQNLAQNSPMLVSGGIQFGTPVEVQVASDVFSEEKKVSKCCLSWVEVAVQQKVDKYTFPSTHLTSTDFRVFQDTISKEISKHSVFPMYKALGRLWKDNPKKLKNLQRASKSDKYKDVLSPRADEPKEQLMQEFLSNVYKDNQLCLEEILAFGAEPKVELVPTALPLTPVGKVKKEDKTEVGVPIAQPLDSKVGGVDYTPSAPLAPSEEQIQTVLPRQPIANE